MSDIAYLDAYCVLGRSLHTGPDQPATVVDLLSAMDHFGIHEALVIDSLCTATNPMAGNRRILVQTHDQPRLHPAWAGLMTHSREFPEPPELVSEMRGSGVGALFLFYGQFDIRLEDWAVDDLLAELEANGVPLILCPNSQMQPGRIDLSDWGNIVRICRKFPELPVVVTESRLYRGQRPLYEALAACPNLKVDLSALWLHRRIEFICQEFGADHLVWGSVLPERGPGASLMQLNYSDISDGELALIAGGNMRQLLSWNDGIVFAPEAVTFPQPVDALHQKVRDRSPFADEKFYDCHGHIGWCCPYHVINDTPETVVAEMDKFGVGASCVFSLQIMGDMRYGTDEVVNMLHAYPDRFIGFTFVNPNVGETLMLEELERGLSLGMQGVKLLPSAYGAYDVNGPLIETACRFAHDHKQLILSHTWGSPERLRYLIERYPDACYIAGHADSRFGGLCREFPNLYICTCPFLSWNSTERFVEMYGANRLLFGSDLLDLPIAWGLGPILYSRISVEDKRLILGGNLRRLMDEYNTYPQGWKE
jgi:uncharacterized protein